MIRQVNQPTSFRSAFTLLEMIISVALVLVLMLAVTKIFSITGAAVGASQGLSAATRDARAAQTVFAHDISSIANDSPFIWIRYHTLTPAFRNKIDEQGDRDYVSTMNSTTGVPTSSQAAHILSIDLDNADSDSDGDVEGDTNVPGEQIGQYTVNFRNHRQDRFSFCARDRFSRQTGNSSSNTLVSNMSSPEAWITYEHLDLPHTNGAFYLLGNSSSGNVTEPGAGTAQSNPQNFYASQWILGRVALVMSLPTNAPSATPVASEYIADSSGTRQEFMQRQVDWNATGAAVSLQPFSDNTPSSVSSSISLQQARYDLLGTDISNGRNVITKWIASGTGVPWYANMLNNRFEVNPFLVKPINAATSSQQVPIFLPACSQFIVEYAGDFISQTSTGAIDTTATNNGLSGDGQVDFVVVNGVRQIQWYGIPRSPTGNNPISPATGDVVTAGDFVKYLTTTFGGTTYNSYTDLNTANFDSWERPTDAAGVYAPGTTLKVSYSNTTAAPTAFPVNFYAAWGPADTNRPKMYRITLVIDRPEMAGRMSDGQTFEYIFNAP